MTPDIERLYERFLNKQCSRQEAEQLLDYFRTDEGNADMVSLIEAELDKPVNEAEFATPAQFSMTESRAKLLQIIQDKKPNATFPIWQWLAIAAALLAVSIIGYELYTTSKPTTQQLTSIYGDDVAPGGNKATITLSDGTTHELSEDKDGIVVNGSDFKYADGERLLVASEQVKNATLNTPRGGQYKVTLPDGTSVTLNAESSLTYPNRFEGATRIVKLTGEAFFDVVKNKERPFIVETQKQQITVTGTSFNVNSYDDKATTTTLVTGTVNLLSLQGSAATKLQPGQQALLSDGNFTTKEIDVQAATGWVRGVFVFQHTSLAQILPQLERWYDITADIHPIPNEEFYADINRNMPLSTVLKAIEKTSDVRFEIKERRLTLKKK